MRIVRLLLGIPLILVGLYLGVVSWLAGCVIQQDAIAHGDPVQGLLFLQGLPPTLGTYVVGAVGMLLIGVGWVVITGGREA